MAVEVLGAGGEIDGYGESMNAFLDAHHSNSRILMNLAKGKPKNAPAEKYDPNHPDNQWPVMVYHPSKPYMLVGKNLAGVNDPRQRAQTEKDNKDALKGALESGYRREPYIKPQIAVLDPAVEKAALVAKNKELEGALVVAHDLIGKLDDRLKALESAKSA